MVPVPVYHITHVSNLESIIRLNGLLCDSEMKQRGVGCREIAYQTIKERRAKKAVPVSARGTLADYVPFYFCNRSPMLLAIYTKQTEDYQSGQGEIIHLVAEFEAVTHGELEWCFTDGHAVEAPTVFFDDVDDLKRIDWTVIEDWEWGDTELDPDRKRRKQAEFLVHRFFPWEAIEAIGVGDETIADATRKIIGQSNHQPVVKVEPKWYYRKKAES